MKIAVASDIHDNLANLEKLLSSIKREKIRVIILCGDLCGKEVLEFLKKNVDKEIYLILGNADRKEEIFKFAENFPEIKVFDKFGEIEIEGLKIGFCHKLDLAKEKIKDFNFIFYGHTHKPWIEKIGNCILANPGNLAGIFFKSTFAILDTKTKKLFLKELF